MMLRFDFPKTSNDSLEDLITKDFVSTAKNNPAMDIAEYQSEYVVVAEMPVSGSPPRFPRMRGFS
jgi:HSP20 family molecular chaperone IbpA